MAIFTTLSVVIWFSAGTLGIFATLVYVLTMRVVIYDILSMAIIRVHCSLDRSRSSLSDQKERNLRVRLEIKGKKIGEKKTIFFYLLSKLLILIFSVVIFGVVKMQKKPIFQFSNSLSDL